MTKKLTYEQLKLFFEAALPRVFPSDHLPPDQHPLAHLARAERVSEKRAMESLRLGIADMLSSLKHEQPEKLRLIAHDLSIAGAPSVAMVRAWFSKKVGLILSRGKIDSEEEFHLVRSVLDNPDLSDEEREELQGLLDRFEFGD
ncbi:hypothetical protein [Luteibacter sp.]|uniref:hypothetical protein n=1 Tax=Luteibacter sp. TaxID=1886636 RepID=UPI003F81559B